MKKIFWVATMVAGILFMNSCKEEDLGPGNPIMEVKTEIANAYFGDSLAFTVNASDMDVPLSTLKAQLYFGEEMVSETVIRTKVSGKDYSGKIFVPYYKDIPNGTATLKYILQNIHFTIVEKTVEVNCVRPQFENLVLVTEDGQQLDMPRVGENQYAVTAEFPQKLNAYIKAPAYGTNGNEITFGYSSDGTITEGTNSYIPFSALEAGTYEVTFNTLTYAGSPFISMKMNEQEFTQVDASTLKIETTMEQGEAVVFEGVPNYENYWIDPDFFTKADDGSLTFIPVSGNYRITADTQKEYFKVEVLDAAMADATLQTDGTGALYIVGGSGTLGTESIGKPSYIGAPSWDGGNGAICMSPIEPKKYQLTVVAGEQITVDGVNFKFYGGKNWGNEYKSDRITSENDFFIVNPGPNDDGNVWLKEGVTLESGTTYVITVDMTDPAHAVMYAVKK